MSTRGEGSQFVWGKSGSERFFGEVQRDKETRLGHHKVQNPWTTGKTNRILNHEDPMTTRRKSWIDALTFRNVTCRDLVTMVVRPFGSLPHATESVSDATR
jgi:hypothetical protein